MTTSSKIKTVLKIVLICGFLAFIGFGWIGLAVGGIVGTIGGLYAVSGTD